MNYTCLKIYPFLYEFQPVENRFSHWIWVKRLSSLVFERLNITCIILSKMNFIDCFTPQKWFRTDNSVAKWRTSRIQIFTSFLCQNNFYSVDEKRTSQQRRQWWGQIGESSIFESRRYFYLKLSNINVHVIHPLTR